MGAWGAGVVGASGASRARGGGVAGCGGPRRCRAVGGRGVGAGVEGRRGSGRVGIASLGQVFGIGGLEEGVDARIVGQLAARKGRDGFVFQTVRTCQAHAQRPLFLLLPTALGNVALCLHRFPALQLGQIGVVMAAVRVLFSMERVNGIVA